jgi:hypothetical protein
MLAIVLVLGSSFFYFVVRERLSETYRCHYCSQIQVGTYHRLKCLILNGQPTDTAGQHEVPHHG